MIRIAMVSFAHMHAWSYASCLKMLPDVELSGIFDENTTRGRKMSKIFQTKYYSKIDKLLEEDIDAVIVCSENAKHKYHTVLAAKSGKHILCEKPIATTIEDAQEMIDTCKLNKVKLMIAFPCRYGSPTIRVKQMIDAGSIGKIIAIKGTNHGMMPGDWFINRKLSGGGAVIDHTVHVVDLMRWITKKEVKSVYAEIDTLFYKFKIDDSATLSMELEDDIFATLDPSWSRPLKSAPFWGDVSMKFVGTDGTIEMNLFGQKFDLYNNDRIKAEWVYWGDNIDLGLIKSFVNCIKNNSEPEITGYDGLKSLEVALAAYKSAKLLKPVRLPLQAKK
jgi:predicted dehydrogenase